MEPIQIELTNEQEALEIDAVQLDRTVRFVLDVFSCTQATVSLAVVNHKTIRRMKYDYLGEDIATDVISFNLNEDSEGEIIPLDCEIVVNAERAVEEATQRQNDPQAELNLYVVHGLLHQLGYDDAYETESQRMHAKEDELLDALGFGKVYSGKGE